MVSRSVKDIPDTDQLYIIIMELLEDKQITIGKLGNFVFPKGTYVYVGSAKKSIKARVARHIFRKKPSMRWHIDYFSSSSTVIGFHTFPLNNGECKLKAFIQEHLQGSVIINGLGSSDCFCSSHLLKVNYGIKEIEDKNLRDKWLKQ